MQQFEVEDSESLCQCLKSLATDGNKHRAKNDRRKQRSIFREVLHYIEVCPVAMAAIILFVINVFCVSIRVNGLFDFDILSG